MEHQIANRALNQGTENNTMSEQSITTVSDIIPCPMPTRKRMVSFSCVIPKQCIESVPRREEGCTGKYQHEVEIVPEGTARGNSQDRILVFSVLPDSGQGTDIVQFIKVMKL